MRDVVIGLTGVCAGLTLLVACSLMPGPKTNAQKCQDVGGVYSAASNTCQFPAETKPK